MKAKFSLLASMGVVALVGAGCSSTSNTTPNVGMENSSDVVVSEVGVDVNVNLDVANVEVVTEEAQFQTGDDVRVDLGYGWYEGKVEDFKCEKGYYIRYKVLSANCFTADKLVKTVAPNPAELVEGAQVIIQFGEGEMFGGKKIYPYYNAEIISVKGDKYVARSLSTKKEYELTIDKIYLK